MQVIRILGPAIALPERLPEEGQFVMTYDPNRGEHGHVTFTLDINKAKKYKDKLEAMADYRAINQSHPTRPDGQPNRPLTAYTVEVVPVVPKAPSPR